MTKWEERIHGEKDEDYYFSLFRSLIWNKK